MKGFTVDSEGRTSSSELLRQHQDVPPIFTSPHYAEEGFLHLLIDVNIIRREGGEREKEGRPERKTLF